MYGTVADFLRDKIQDGSSLSFVSAYFTINAFHQLKDKLTNIKDLRFLFGEPSFIQGMDPSKTESKIFRLTEEGLELKNYLPQNAIAKACYDWIEDKVEIKSEVPSLKCQRLFRPQFSKFNPSFVSQIRQESDTLMPNEDVL